MKCSELGIPLGKTNNATKRIANLSDSTGYFVYTVDSEGRKTMTEDSHIPCLTLSKIRNLPWCWPSQLGAEYPLVRRELVHILGGRSFWLSSPWGTIADHIVIDALWRSTPSLIWYRVFRNIVLKHASPAPERFVASSSVNPLTNHPGLLFNVADAYRAGSPISVTSKSLVMNRSEEEESSLRLTPPCSDPETEILPSARHLLSELLLLRSSQLILDEQECQSRIDRLTEIVKKEDAEDILRYNAHMREESDSSTEFFPVPEDPSDRELSVGWEPTPWQCWRKWLDEGAPDPQHCVDLFRLVLVGDFPYPHYDVYRWIWLILDREVCMRRTDPISGLYPGICSFKDLHIYLRRDNRPGMGMWRDLGIRRLRSDYCPFPFDFAEISREAQDNELGPDTFILGLFGADATCETMDTGVRDPTSDDAGNLDWGDLEGELSPPEEPAIQLFPAPLFFPFVMMGFRPRMVILIRMLI